MNIYSMYFIYKIKINLDKGIYKNMIRKLLKWNVLLNNWKYLISQIVIVVILVHKIYNMNRKTVYWPAPHLHDPWPTSENRSSSSGLPEFEMTQMTGGKLAKGGQSFAFS